MKKIALLMLVFTLLAVTNVYAQKLKNGTYKGNARGYSSEMSVTIAVSGRKIKEISVYQTDGHDIWMRGLISGDAIDNNNLYRGYPIGNQKQRQDYEVNSALLKIKKEGPRYTSVQEFVDAIVKNQSTVIDVMSGATVTCEAVIEAVHDALRGKNSDIVSAWEQEGTKKRLATAQRRNKLKEEERQRIAEAEAEAERRRLEAEAEAERKRLEEEERRILAAKKLEQELQNPVTPDASEFKYDVASDGGVKIIKYLGEALSIRIPEKIEGLPVTEIATDAFDKNTLVKIVITTNIKNMSFSGFTELREVILEDGVTNIQGARYGPWGDPRIEDGVFASCTNLTKVVLPNSLKSIGAAAFYKCEKLESVELPAKLKKIGEYAFAKCGLISTDIPNSVTDIGKAAFTGCKNLKSVKLSAGLTELGGSVDRKISECGIFEDSGLESIIIPDSVTEIGEYTFSRCKNLKSVTFYASLKEIEKGAFSGCSSLSEIIIPDTLKSIYFSERIYTDNYADAFSRCNFSLATKSKLRELGYSGEF